MTTGEFCDAAYAVILEEKIRGGASLIEASDELIEWAQGVGDEVELRRQAAVARQNDRALAALQGAFGA